LGKYNFNGYSADTLRSKEWKPKSQNFAHFMVNRKINNSQIRLKSYFFKESIVNFGQENFPPFDGTAIDQYYRTYRNINDIKFSHKNNRYSFNGLVSIANTNFSKEQYQVDLIQDTLIQTENPDYNAEDLFKAAYSRMEYNRLDLGKLSAQVGVEIRQENVSGSKIQMGEAETFEYALFSKSEIIISPIFKTQLGLRLPYHSIYSAPVIPSIHLQLSPFSWITWRGSLARGFRAPSIKELFMEFIDFNHNIVGNSNLNAEYSNALNSSITITPIKKEQYYLKLDVESSLQFLKDKINLAQIENSTGYTYFNLSDATYYGINASLTAKVSHSSNLQIGWNHFITESSELYDPIVRQNFNFIYNFTSSKYLFGGNINVKAKAKSMFQRLEQELLVNFEQEGYQLVNMNLFKDLQKLDARITLGVKNLLDVTNIVAAGEQTNHSSSESIISWGRTYFAQFKINFQ
jgi:outer membrane receptor for ferrienterochelin and colicins